MARNNRVVVEKPSRRLALGNNRLVAAEMTLQIHSIYAPG